MFSDIVAKIRTIYSSDSSIPLHAPAFRGNEKHYLEECIDSTFVSSVGPFVDRFEQIVASVAGTKFAVAVANGTEALHIALLLAGVKPNELVLTQALTFVATANAISYCGAHPCFVDISKTTLGMSPASLEHFLAENTVYRDGKLVEKRTNRRIAACVPVHVFGHPCEIDKIIEICDKFNLPVVEDAAEAVGSKFANRSAGSWGKIGVFSFNGNKIVTCGGGGALVTHDENIAKMAKHLTTTAKLSHAWEYKHDMVGYNYRLPNLNAALACAQLEQLEQFIASKRAIADEYLHFFSAMGVQFVQEPPNAYSNYWLNAILLKDREERNRFLTYTNERGVMTRPCWTLMHRLPMYAEAPRSDLPVSEWIEDRLVNIPSSATL